MADYAPSFTRNKRGNFNADSSIISLVQGSNSYRIDDEFNEEAWLYIDGMRRLLRALCYSGIITGTYGDNGTGFLLSNAVFTVDGLLYTLDDTVQISYPSAPAEGVTLYSILFLEFWVREVKYTDTIYRRGHYGGTSLENKIQDDRVVSLHGGTAETTRRLVLEYQPRVVSGVDFTTYPDGMSDPDVCAKYVNVNQSSTAFTRSAAPDNGLYYADSSTFGVLGRLYALPIAKVVQTNTTTDVYNLVSSRVLEPVGQELSGDLSTTRISFSDTELVQNDATGAIEVWKSI